jgi:hypothetical protein
METLSEKWKRGAGRRTRSPWAVNCYGASVWHKKREKIIVKKLMAETSTPAHLICSLFPARMKELLEINYVCLERARTMLFWRGDFWFWCSSERAISAAAGGRFLMCERGENISQKKYAIFGVKTAKFPEREIAASLCGWICTNIIAADANSFLICQNYYFVKVLGANWQVWNCIEKIIV